MLKRIGSALARKTPLRWHLANKMTRMQLIQYAVDQLEARTYLEIGVDEGQAFAVIRAPFKIGVDPIAPRPAVEAELKRADASYFAIGSDEFFERHAPQVLAGGADVVFIDGLHTYDQTYRDIQHALGYLSPGGIILVHDCLPASALEATVASSYAAAWRTNGPGWDGMWTGDTWKAIVAVRSGHAGAHACVLDCDHGVGVVYKGEGPTPLPLSLEAIAALDYQALAKDPGGLLGVFRPAQLRFILGRLRRTRTSA